MPFITGGSSGAGGGGAISGVTITGTAAAGNVPVASSSSAGTWAVPPGGEIGYDQITTHAVIAGTTAGTATTVITCASHTFDGGPVLLTFFSPQIYLASGGPANAMNFLLSESGTQLAVLGNYGVSSAGGQAEQSLTLMYRFTPSAAGHIYVVSAYVTTATGNPEVSAGSGGTGTTSYTPAFVRFTKV